MSAQELELAVLYAYNPPGVGEEAARVKAQATRYCEEVKGSKDGWRLALEVFRGTTRAEARFFALGCLQEALGARAGAIVRVDATQDRALIREAVMMWLTTAGGAELEAQETFIRTKVAVVVALLIKSDYPEAWPSAFEELQSLLTAEGGNARGAAHIDLYLRVLCALDEEVVSFHVDRSREETEHNSLIKDSMRLSNAVAQICGVIYEVVAAFRADAPQVSAFALETLGKYIGWIDIAQVANSRFLSLFADCLQSADEQLVQRSCSCILEVVNKKMADPVAKLRFLQELKLTDMLKQVPLSDEAVAVRVAELVDGVVRQLVSVWDKLEPAAFGGGGSGMPTSAATSPLVGSTESDATVLRATAMTCSAMLHEALPMLWACVSHPDVDVSFACLDAVGALLQTLKRQLQAERKASGGADGGGGVARAGGGGAACTAAGETRFRALGPLPQLLTVLYQRMRYPPDFSFDPSDEDEGEEDMLRQQIRKHLVNAVRQAPELVLDFLCRALSSLATPLSSLPFPDLEAALRLVFHFGEGCGGVSGLNSASGGAANGARRAVAAGASELLRTGAFPQMVLALHESDVSQHKHPQVLMLYFQLTVRYSKLLAEGPSHLLPKVLEALCGPQGLSSQDLTLRTRSCYFLTKLVKGLRDGVAPYVDVIVQGVQALLDSRGSRLDLSDEAKLNLYETIGYLIGMPDVLPATQVRHLDAVLGPQMSKIANRLQAATAFPVGGEQYEAAAADVAGSVAAIANVSKGFKAVLASEVEGRFLQALEAASSALAAFPRHAALRAKTMFLMHGLIPCLGERLLRALSLATLLLLIRDTDGKDLMEVTQLLNQLTIEYGPKSAHLLDGALLPYIRRVYELLPGAGSNAAAAAPSATPNGAQKHPGEGPMPGRGQGPLEGQGPGAANGAAITATTATSLFGQSSTQAASGAQLLAHEIAERTGMQKLYLSVLQHVVANGLSGVLSSPTNGSHLDDVLRSVVAGLVGAEDAGTKKTCLYIFALLLGSLNRSDARGTPNASASSAGSGVDTGGGKIARTASWHRRAQAGKGGGLWQGSGPTVDMEPGVRAAVTAFVMDEVVRAALRCLTEAAPAGLDLRDATAVSAVVHMGALLKEAKVAGSGSAGFVAAAALACKCSPQVAEQLQRAVEEASDGPAITTALKAFSQHVRPPR